jgi:hypothetical protein
MLRAEGDCECFDIAAKALYLVVLSVQFRPEGANLFGGMVRSGRGQTKGTLTLLEEWLLQEIIWSDPDTFREVIIKPLRDVRRSRQTPAHVFTKDNFSAEYHDKRKRLLWDIYNSLSNMRATFAKHPRAGHVEIPDWLDNGRIDVF